MEWDPVHKVLVDHMGYPLSRSAALEYRKYITEHLKNTPDQLSDLMRELLEENHPSMVKQVDLSPERFE